MAVQHRIQTVDFIERLDLKLILSSTANLREQPENIADLVESIRNVGLLQPIIVRPSGDRYEVVAGNRRLKAHAELGLRKISAIIKELSDQESFEVALIENVSRGSLNPLEEARAFKKYVIDNGWGSVTGLSKMLGKSPAYISQRIKLLDLPFAVLEKLEKSLICVSSARELTNLKDPIEQDKLATAIALHKLSVLRARSLVKRQATEDNSEGQRNDSSKKNAILKSSVTAVRLTLYRLDLLIEESEGSVELTQFLREIRNEVHEIIDQIIRKQIAEGECW